MKNYLIALCLLILFISAPSVAAPSRYIIVVDAGSTGSRLHLFQYVNDKKLPLIIDVYSGKSAPGLSDFANNPEAAGDSLKNMLDEATVELQKNHIDPHKVAINIYGTGGLRILPQSTQNAIYANVISTIQNQYEFSIGNIKTITGKLEGIYGWLDINYLLKTFDTDTDTTRGSIDMGGASAQIAFSNPTSFHAEDEEMLTINGKTYNIFSKSFLGIGLIQAISEINSYPFASSCYPADYAFANNDRGSFNFAACDFLYSYLITKHQVAQQVPSLDNHNFIAYSGIYYTDNFFNVGKTPTHETMSYRIQSMCNKPWDQLVNEHPEISEKYLALYCAFGVHLTDLLYNIYQLQGSQITVTNRINQEEIDWPLGALLYSLLKGDLQ